MPGDRILGRPVGRDRKHVDGNKPVRGPRFRQQGARLPAGARAVEDSLVGGRVDKPFVAFRYHNHGLTLGDLEADLSPRRRLRNAILQRGRARRRPAHFDKVTSAVVSPLITAGKGITLGELRWVRAVQLHGVEWKPFRLALAEEPAQAERGLRAARRVADRDQGANHKQLRPPNALQHTPPCLPHGHPLNLFLL